MDPDLPVGCLFTTEGEIIRIFLEGVEKADDLKPSILGKDYADQPSMYLFGFPDNYFLFMHEDNDFLENYKASSLKVNTAIQRYFPNSPFKGNLLLVKIDEDDYLQGGSWWSSVLRKYVLGYDRKPIFGEAKINSPMIVPKEEVEDYDLVDYPIPPKKKESRKKASKKKPKRICDLCNKSAEELFHTSECQVRCTKKIVKKVTELRKANPNMDQKIKNLSKELLKEKKCTWREITSFKCLLQKSFDSTGIRWFNLFLKLFDGLKDELEKYVVLDGLIAVAYCFDVNSQYNGYFTECPYCKKVGDECSKERLEVLGLVKDSLEFLDYPNFKDFNTIAGFPHLTLNIYFQLFHQLKEAHTHSEKKRKVTEPLICAMIFEWSDLLLDQVKLGRLLAGADALLGW